MRKMLGIACMMAALLWSLMLGAAGAEGRAVIDAGSSTKLHLRSGASVESKSKGLYFTGTQVICESDTVMEWVKVTVGVETGYMKSEFLRVGNAAQSVMAAQPEGTVNAPKSWVNFRQGPSADTARVGKLVDGQKVTVLGETASHWYYAEADGVLGYVKAAYVTLEEAQDSVSADGGQEQAAWKAAYAAVLQAENAEGNQFCLIDVNGDDVPELVVNTGFEAGGCRIYTYTDGKVDMLQTDRLHFTYLPGKNLLCNSEGLMGYYYDMIYEIRSGKWQSVAQGTYDGLTDACDEERGRYICQNYAWNGVTVTREAYMAALDALYDETDAVEPEGYVGYDTIMKMLAE